MAHRPLIALLLLGYRLPLPYGVVLAAAALPAGAYLLAGAVAPRISPDARKAYVVFLMSASAGLLVALIAATMGLSAVGLLLMVAVLAGVASSRLISRHVSFNDDYWRPPGSP